MSESAELKCKICGEMLIGKLHPTKSICYAYCPSMDKTHDIYVITVMP